MIPAEPVLSLADAAVAVAGCGSVGGLAAWGLAGAGVGRLLLLLNPDCEIERGTLERGAALLASRPEAALVGGRLLNPDGTDQRGSRRRELTPGSAIVEALRLDLLGLNRVNRHQDVLPEEPIAIDCISGAFMLMPRSVYEAVGGMDGCRELATAFYAHVANDSVLSSQRQ